HALAPRLPEPIIGLALSSSGQRERGANDMPSSPLASPERMRSSPAQAIIAALSVQSAIGGATRRISCAAQRRSSVARIALLAATPPATTRAGVAALGYTSRKRARLLPTR